MARWEARLSPGPWGALADQPRQVRRPEAALSFCRALDLRDQFFGHRHRETFGRSRYAFGCQSLPAVFAEARNRRDRDKVFFFIPRTEYTDRIGFARRVSADPVVVLKQEPASVA